MDLLGQLDDPMLKNVGVSSARHRLRIRNAIAKLASATTARENATDTNNSRQTIFRTCRALATDVLRSGRFDCSLSPARPPEDLRAFMGDYQRCCTDLIECNVGFVAKYIDPMRRGSQSAKVVTSSNGCPAPCLDETCFRAVIGVNFLCSTAFLPRLDPEDPRSITNPAAHLASNCQACEHTASIFLCLTHTP
jgi:hypothetical protein